MTESNDKKPIDYSSEASAGHGDHVAKAQQDTGPLIQAVANLTKAKSALEDLEESVKHEKAYIRGLVTQVLPDIMHDMGIERIDLQIGIFPSATTVTLKDIVSASIPKANVPGAYLWLREKGFGDIIKNTLTMTFGQGEDEQPAKVLAVVDAAGLAVNAVRKEAIHAGKLKAFVREQLDVGTVFPESLFAIFRGTEAVVN